MMNDRNAVDRRRGRPDRARPIAAGLLVATLAALAVADDRVDGARSALERWLETRRLISDEKRDWTLGRELLEGRIDLVHREIHALRQRIAEAERGIDDTDGARTELAEESARLEAAAAALDEPIADLEARMRGMIERFPEPLRDRVRMLGARLPAEAEETKLSRSERFLTVVGILNEADKFNREISVVSEVRAMPDGTSVEVATLYAGLGRCWSVSADGRVAGTGIPGPGGWSWRPAPGAAAEIARAIAVHGNEEPAAFVRLPLETDPAEGR